MATPGFRRKWRSGWKELSAVPPRLGCGYSSSMTYGRTSSAPGISRSPASPFLRRRHPAEAWNLYLNALAARDNGIPFYIALPSPTIDWEIESGAAIPIERRDDREVTHIEGWTDEGRRVAVRLTPARSA